MYPFEAQQRALAPCMYNVFVKCFMQLPYNLILICVILIKNMTRTCYHRLASVFFNTVLPDSSSYPQWRPAPSKDKYLTSVPETPAVISTVARATTSLTRVRSARIRANTRAASAPPTGPSNATARVSVATSVLKVNHACFQEMAQNFIFFCSRKQHCEI